MKGSQRVVGREQKRAFQPKKGSSSLYCIFRIISELSPSRISSFCGFFKRLAFFGCVLGLLGFPIYSKKDMRCKKFLESRLLLVLGSNVEREVKVMNQKNQTKEQQIYLILTWYLNSLINIYSKTKYAFTV